MTHIPHESLDKLDRRIVSTLLLNGRETIANMSRNIGLSRTAVAERMARLERAGIIAGYTAKLGHSNKDKPISCFQLIKCTKGAKSSVCQGLQQIPEVKNVSIVGGEFSIIATVEAASLHSLHLVNNEIESIKDIEQITTSVVMHQPISRDE